MKMCVQLKHWMCTEEVDSDKSGVLAMETNEPVINVVISQFIVGILLLNRKT